MGGAILAAQILSADQMWINTSKEALVKSLSG